MSFTNDLLAKGILPDFILRYGIRQRLAQTLKEEIKPTAEQQMAALQQHITMLHAFISREVRKSQSSDAVSRRFRARATDGGTGAIAMAAVRDLGRVIGLRCVVRWRDAEKWHALATAPQTCRTNCNLRFNCAAGASVGGVSTQEFADIIDHVIQ